MSDRTKVGAGLAAALAATACVAQPSMSLRVDPTPCRAEPPQTEIRWLAPDARRDRERLDDWCSTVGPVAVAEGRLPAAPSPTDSLAIVAWNVHVGDGNLRRLVAELRAGAFTQGAPVSAFVLLLQEAQRGHLTTGPVRNARHRIPQHLGRRLADHPSNDILATARDLGLAGVYVPAMRNGPTDEDRGNAILSTLPLSDVSIVELPFERQRRLAVAATVSGSTSHGHDWRVRVVSVHFDTGLMLGRGGAGAARKRQARALIDAIAASPLPLVVGGDFNTSAGVTEPALDVLYRALPSARQAAGVTWEGPLGLKAQLDYLLARFPGDLFPRVPGDALRVTRLPQRFGSDHYPLLVVAPVRAGAGSQAIRSLALK